MRVYTLQDTLTGFVGDANKQIDDVCQQIRSNNKLSAGFNALGLSQGGQFLLVANC